MIIIVLKERIVGLGVYLLILMFTGNIEPSLSTDSKTKCTTEWVLGQVKNYLESEDFGIFLSASSGTLARIIDPQTIWDNLQGIENICDSEEARFLQAFCGNQEAMLIEIVSLWLNEETNLDNLIETYAKTIHLQAWTYVMDAAVRIGKGGRRLEHYCDRLQGIDLAANNLNYDEVNRRLKELAKFSLQTVNHGTTLNLKVTKHTNDVLKSSRRSVQRYDSMCNYCQINCISYFEILYWRNEIRHHILTTKDYKFAVDVTISGVDHLMLDWDLTKQAQMGERVSKLEADVKELKGDVKELKTDVKKILELLEGRGIDSKGVHQVQDKDNP